MKTTDLLLITPPLTQLNCPYPATMVLSGYLRSKDFNVSQLDLSMELIDALFSKENISRIFDLIENQKLSKRFLRMLARRDEYEEIVEKVKQFLQSPENTVADTLLVMESLPQSHRFKTLKNLEFLNSKNDRINLAISMATFFIQDLGDLIRENVNPHFELIKYGEKICSSISDFKIFQNEIEHSKNFINDLMLNILDSKIKKANPKCIGFTVPFPGNFYAALICAKFIKTEFPSIKIVMGGGFVNTELRQMIQADLFQYIDYLVFDDGELPLERILENFKFPSRSIGANSNLIRTWTLENGEIIKHNFESKENIPFGDRKFADYSDIQTKKYISLMETPNPMHSLWSVGFWNKITLAHGCYWAQCAFCDTTIDYIRRFEPAKAEYLVDQMEAIIKQTGSNGFHFTDEAAPPALLRKVSNEIIRRNLKIRWWGNIRFEKNFTAGLCELMSKAGCIAVSGGLETVSPRLLKLINKGVDLESATQTLNNFKQTNIMVHAYLMYGFPSQTTQETTDALEIVRQWFKSGLIQSGFWHRYAMTTHSPSASLTIEYGIKLLSKSPNPFANNEIYFDDPTPTDHLMLGEGLRKALYNYMLGNGFELSLNGWFDEKVPKISVDKNLIINILN